MGDAEREGATPANGAAEGDRRLGAEKRPVATRRLTKREKQVLAVEAALAAEQEARAAQKRARLKRRKEEKKQRRLEAQGAEPPQESRDPKSGSAGGGPGSDASSAVDLASAGARVARLTDSIVAKNAREKFKRLSKVQRLPNSRAVREYVDQVLCPELEKSVVALLQRVFYFHERTRLGAAAASGTAQRMMIGGGRTKKRILCGMREIHRSAKNGRLKMLVVSTDIEESRGKGGLDDVVSATIRFCRENETPVVFALTRRRLGKALGKKIKMSCVGILDPDGAHELFKPVARAAERLQREWKSRVDGAAEAVRQLSRAGDAVGGARAALRGLELSPDDAEIRAALEEARPAALAELRRSGMEALLRSCGLGGPTGPADQTQESVPVDVARTLLMDAAALAPEDPEIVAALASAEALLAIAGAEKLLAAGAHAKAGRAAEAAVSTFRGGDGNGPDAGTEATADCREVLQAVNGALDQLTKSIAARRAEAKKEKEKRIERKRRAKEEALRRNVAEVGSREVSSAAATLDAEWPTLG
jgi:ribosomal protein L7Ae-like RNA K-turn-binding protein